MSAEELAASSGAPVGAGIMPMPGFGSTLGALLTGGLFAVAYVQLVGLLPPSNPNKLFFFSACGG